MWNSLCKVKLLGGNFIKSLKRIILFLVATTLLGCSKAPSTTPSKEKPDYEKREKPYVTQVKDTEDKIVTCLNPFNSNNAYTVIITKDKKAESEECYGRIVLFENDQEITSQDYSINFGKEIDYNDYEINWSSQQCIINLIDDNNNQQIIKINTDGKIIAN